MKWPWKCYDEIKMMPTDGVLEDGDHEKLWLCLRSVKQDLRELLIWNQVWKWLIPLLVALNLINIAL